MAIVVLVLWLFTAGAGFYLLFTSSLSRARPAGPAPQPTPAAQPTPVTQSAAVTQPAAAASAANATAPPPPPPQTPAPPPLRRREPPTARPRAAPRGGRPGSAGIRPPWSRPARRRSYPAPGRWWSSPTLTGGIIGLAFWLGFTLVHNRALGWIGFGLAAATACVGLAWFTANTRAARRANPARPAPSFVGRLAALHGSAAALTVALAALTALVLRA